LGRGVELMFPHIYGDAGYIWYVDSISNLMLSILPNPNLH